MIRCWLSASVSPKIAEQMLICESAKDFWDELVENMGKLMHHNYIYLRMKLMAFRRIA